MERISRKANLLKPFNVDNIEVRKDEYFADAFIVDLPLDSMPDHIWQDIFESKWRTSRHLWDRKLFVIGDKLRLVTSPDDFQAKLDWVEAMIHEANNAVDEQILASEREQERRTKDEVLKQTLWEEKARIEIIKETLRRKF